MNDRPHVAPVWYGYDDGHVHILTGGRKLENASQNPRVAISIEKHADGDAEWMVVMQGTAATITDSARINDAARRIFSKYLGPTEAEWAEYYREALTDEPNNTLLDVRIGSATATRF
ncbi:pyridoxamine 5'-phosphate oxidase family protein [Halegenticoccus tardaugens]|uniref:pyridoxamine 5'-phosphate oxidase family protein n=1 Tax=Halegenticoccus tardaugens TaxID=2071624 RepID=UPI001E304629|nr:pyridoxamine 5'-phosphate oxidase family protein [Halegenticoccus tardaugens]